MSVNLTDRSAMGGIDVWLGRAVCLAVIAMMASCCWFMWRISMVAYRTEQAVVAIAGDLKAMSTTGAQISEHLQQVDRRLQTLEAKASDAMNVDELEHIIDEVNLVRDANAQSTPQPSGETEREIKHLLTYIRKSGLRFTYADENRSAARFYAQLYVKYKSYQNTVTSTEEFIAKVATSTVAGRPYQVVVSPTETLPLGEWLTTELAAYRERPAMANDRD